MEYPPYTFSAPESAPAEADADAEDEALPDSVSAGPSQCQWSLCGSQPTDSLGLGSVGVAEEEAESVDVPVAVASAEAGPSQCLLS